jgi:hypothetical protein
LASQGRNSPLCLEIKAHFCRRRPPHLTDLSVMPARAAPGAGDQRQDLLEHLPRHRDFGHLKAARQRELPIGFMSKDAPR